jgi:predicted AlkP superfamily pyrophosphatase or phosphodiesterase
MNSEPQQARRWFLLLIFLCLPLAAQAQQDQPPYLLLVGIDGLRWDIIDRHPAPTLRRLAAQGVRAQGVVPVMPSKTFPNFYAIATGLYPDRNGVLDNASYDPALDMTFRMSLQDDPRWFQGEPIWVTAERQGLRAATMFWVGSGAEIDGIRPTYWHPFDGSIPNAQRVAQVLAWFALEESQRPRFLSVYFEAIDSASHSFGVDSAEERAAVLAVDNALSELLQGLEAQGVLSQTNVMVVGDHGMTDLSAERIIYVDDYVDLSDLYSPQLSGDRQGNAVFAAFHGEAQEVERVYRALALAHPHMSVYRKSGFPEWFKQGHPQREPDLIIMPDLGWMLSKRGIPYEGPRASHGFNPHERDMHASFIAAGPAFKTGEVVEPFPIVDIYNIMAHVLKLSPANNDGNPARIVQLLRE